MVWKKKFDRDITVVEILDFYRLKDNSLENPWYYYMGLRSGDGYLMRDRPSSVKNWNGKYFIFLGTVGRCAKMNQKGKKNTNYHKVGFVLLEKRQRKRIEIAISISDKKKQFPEIMTLMSLFDLGYYTSHQVAMKAMEES